MPAAVNRHPAGKTPNKVAKRRLTIAAISLFTLPVLVGMAGILVPAAGYFPVLGKTTLSIAPATQFLDTAGLAKAALLSLTTGLLATFLSVAGSFLLLVACFNSWFFGWLHRLAGPLVAIPHAAVAIGIVFLLAPSGWLIRLLSPGLTGFDRPPVWSLVPDPHGLALIFGLMAKEIPFLLLIAMAATARLPVQRLADVATSLGYGRYTGWGLVILPSIYRQVRLPIIAVLVFSLSVVDMALLLAPTLPPPLSVLVLNGFYDADLAARLPASFGAVLQIGVALCGVGMWLVGERGAGGLAQFWARRGWRSVWLDRPLAALASLACLPMAAAFFGLLAALIWSFAASWFFPDALPSRFSLIHWQNWSGLGSLLWASGGLALSASMLSLLMVCLWLYWLGPFAANDKSIAIALFLPLLVPQVSFLFGLQMTLSWTGMDGTWPALIYSHMIFIMPYTWMIMAPAFTAMDWRYDQVATSLGKGMAARVLGVHLPLLAYPIGTAVFIGVAVSVALYLPTVFVGGGRISTVTVEAVSLAAGGGRGDAGVAALLQILIPSAAFLVVQWGLKIRFGRFRAMQAGKRR